ncbi:MAG TPA: DUF4129 domain-containing protein [Puia sp.]|nr:DUF4129 domain-containing protein [Puia sp.]
MLLPEIKTIELNSFMNLLLCNTKSFIYKSSLLVLILLTGNFFTVNAQTDPLPDSVTAADAETATSIPADSTITDSSNTNTVNTEDTATLRIVPDTVVNIFKKNKDFEYANDPAYLKKEPVNNEKGVGDYFFEFITGKGFRIFAYILIAAVLIFAFYKIVIANKLYLFYSKPKKLSVAETGETELDTEDIDQKIEESWLANNYRFAIRYMHLKALRLLDENKLISFHVQATNHEYAYQLSKTKFGKDFLRLTNVYEYTWYGGFNLTEQQALVVKENFEQFYTSVKV